MTKTEKAMISITRQPVKNIIFFLLVFVLGNFLSSAISIRQAIFRTQDALFATMPAVVTIEWEHEVLESYIEKHGIQFLHADALLTREEMLNLAHLPQVTHMEFTLETHVFSNELQRHWNPAENDGELDWLGIADLSTDGTERFWLRGTETAQMLDFESNMFTMNSGRGFTNEEIVNGELVALIPRTFAELNELEVGTIVRLSNRIYSNWHGEISEDHYNEEWAEVVEEFDIEIIGVFDINQRATSGTGSDAFVNSATENTFIVPNTVVYSILTFYFENDLNEIEGVTLDATLNQFRHPIYVLNDVREIQTFRVAAQELLPNFWTVADMTSTFEFLLISMENFSSIAEGLLLASIIATVILSSLFILLFLRDRRQELGTYLALGEKKEKIIAQILLEVTMTAIIALIFSLFTGDIIARNMSQQMLTEQISTLHEERLMMGYHINDNTQFVRLMPEQMNVEEMIEAFDTSLDMNTMIMFVVIGFMTFSVSTLIPTFYIVKLNPKEILLQSKIG